MDCGGGDGDWTAWYGWRLGTTTYNDGQQAMVKGQIPSPTLVPFGAQTPPPEKIKTWNADHRQEPLISVVIPVGPGHDKYLVDTLDSLLAQTFSDWEAVVVNDTGKLLDLKAHPWARVVNVVNGFGLEAGKPLASNPRIAKIAFTGETSTGRLIMQYATENIIPVTLELGGKSPNIFFKDVMAEDDAFLDKAIEGFVLFALNQGEVCTCPSRALIQEDIYDAFMERAIARTAAIIQGDPRVAETMIGAQASSEQKEKILSYFDIGRHEGAEVLIGGEAVERPVILRDGEHQLHVGGPARLAHGHADPQVLAVAAGAAAHAGLGHGHADALAVRPLEVLRHAMHLRHRVGRALEELHGLRLADEGGVGPGGVAFLGGLDGADVGTRRDPRERGLGVGRAGVNGARTLIGDDEPGARGDAGLAERLGRRTGHATGKRGGEGGKRSDESVRTNHDEPAGMDEGGHIASSWPTDFKEDRLLCSDLSPTAATF